MHKLRWQGRRDDDLHLDYQHHARGRVSPEHYRRLSGAEQDTVLIEFAVELAASYANANPTLLVVDLQGSCFDETWLAAISDRLSAPGLGFQTLVLDSEGWPSEESVWEGWRLVNLVDHSPNPMLWPRSVQIVMGS